MVMGYSLISFSMIVLKSLLSIGIYLEFFIRSKSASSGKGNPFVLLKNWSHSYILLEIISMENMQIISTVRKSPTKPGKLFRLRKLLLL